MGEFRAVLECLEKEEEALDLGTSAPLVGNQIEQVNEGSKGMLDGARATVGIIRVTEHTQLTINPPVPPDNANSGGRSELTLMMISTDQQSVSKPRSVQGDYSDLQLQQRGERYPRLCSLHRASESKRRG